MARYTFAMIAVVAFLFSSRPADAWGNQGHRLVALVASQRLSTQARTNVRLLLGSGENLADVASWADTFRYENPSTGPWHSTYIPAGEIAYDRDRDCPTPLNARKGSDRDKWRDCAADRILQFEQRLSDSTLDRTDRALALKFLVHLVGDQHQPMHATGFEKGGSGIRVTIFGQAVCGDHRGPCNLHSVWDSGLIEYAGLTEQQYLEHLNALIRTEHLAAGTRDTGLWASEAKKLADVAMLPQAAEIDQAYYDREIKVVDRQLAVAGLRLAEALNAVLGTPFKFTLQPWKPFPPS